MNAGPSVLGRERPAPSPSRPRSAAAAFFGGILRSPLATGAIAPSSRRLARLMVREARIPQSPAILELGAGTGVVTAEILRRKPPGARVLSIEWNPAFVAELEERYPEIIAVADCASRLAEHARNHGIRQAGSVVSALPWTIFEPARQEAILRASRDLLTPDGVFTTIACLGPHITPGGRRFRRRLESVFSEVRESRTVVLNVPPAFVYVCRK